MTVSSNQLLQQERWPWQETWNGAASFVLALQKGTQSKSWQLHLICALIDILSFFQEAQGDMTYDQARGLCYLAAYLSQSFVLIESACALSQHIILQKMANECTSWKQKIIVACAWSVPKSCDVMIHWSFLISNVFYTTETISICCVPSESQTSIYK